MIIKKVGLTWSASSTRHGMIAVGNTKREAIAGLFYSIAQRV